MFGRRRRPSADETHLDGLRGLYGALGFGFPAEALRIFGLGDPGGERLWCLRHLGRTVRCLETGDLSNRELFALPETWEVIGVAARSLAGRRGKRGDRISVLGTFHCRPRGTWENVSVPFHHVWTMCAGKAVLFENLVDETVLRPGAGTIACSA